MAAMAFVPRTPDADLDTDDPRVALGHAISGRADDVATSVLAAWADRRPAAEIDEDVDRAIRVNVTTTCRLGTELVGRWVATGATMTAQESRRVARSGEATAAVSASLVDVTKHYLGWRDHTLRVVVEESRRLGVDPALAREVSNVVRHACDANLVEMVRQFDVERHELQRQLDAEHATLVHMATHDPLTGLANRSLLLERLGDALAAAGRKDSAVAVLFLDLDDFKKVNDERGHEEGDRLLVSIAERLVRNVRSTDTVARLGGDEFVVVCPDVFGGEPDARSIAERIRTRFSQPFEVDGEISVTASVGVVLATAASTAKQVLSQADAAMYQVKHTRPPQAS